MGSSRRRWQGKQPNGGLLVAWAEKREIFARVLAGDRDLPSARLAPVGKMRLFADAAAAGRSAP
jgi:hypothetical protein